MLAFIQKNLFWFILLSIGGGLVILALTGGYPFTPVFCLLAALVMIYPSLLPLDFFRIKEVGRHWHLIILTLIVNFVIAPGLAFLLGWLFLSQTPELWIGLILLSVLPGGGMVTTWAYKSKADMALVIGIIFANLAAAILLVPLYITLAINKLMPAIASSDQGTCSVEQVSGGAASCFFGGEGGVNPLKIALPIFVIIIFPLMLAYLTQNVLRRKYKNNEIESIKKKFAAFSNLGMLIIIFLLMGIKNNRIIFDQPDLLLKSIIPLILFYGLSLLISWSLYKFKAGAIGKALAWGTYLRYITLALGLAISLIYQDERYSLTVVVVILEYLVQIPSSFWLTNRFNK